MKIAISCGHNIYNNGVFDRGASSGKFIEADINKETVKLLIPLLKLQGHEVLDITPYGGKFNTTREHHVLRGERVNEFKPDLLLDIHINAGGGTGVECWVYSKTTNAYPYASDICNSISNNINIPNRGVKINPSYYTLSLNNYPSIIIEGAFIDNPTDMTKLNPKNYAESIAIVFGDIKKEDVNTETNFIYRVQVGAYSIRENAERLLGDLKDKGFIGVIQAKEIKVEVKPMLEDYLEYKFKNLYVQETIPELCYVGFASGKNLKQLSVVGINGTWQDNKNAHNKEAIWGLLANKFGAIGGNSHQNSPNVELKRGTIVYYEDETIDIVRVNNIGEFTKPIIWAIGGGSLYPNIFPEESFASDIFRKTKHTAVGIRKGRVFQIVSLVDCTMNEFKNMVTELKLEKAIFLDGGGSSQMNTRSGNGLYSSRGLASGLFIKGGN